MADPIYRFIKAARQASDELATAAVSRPYSHDEYLAVQGRYQGVREMLALAETIAKMVYREEYQHEV